MPRRLARREEDVDMFVKEEACERSEEVRVNVMEGCEVSGLGLPGMGRCGWGGP